MEDTRRTGQRDPRLHRDLAQHPPTPQRPEHAHTQRIREPTPTTRDHRLIPNPRLHESRGRSKCPPNRVHSTFGRSRGYWISVAPDPPPKITRQERKRRT